MHRMNKILVANRGEIALRVIRSIQEMGIETVAVYSEADRLSPHVMAADEAVCIGPPPPADSYLSIETLIRAAQSTQSHAIHPGYGFLSENPSFAAEVAKNGIIFIGPSVKSIRLMGNKLEAKKALASYDIPFIPGTMEPTTNLSEAKKNRR